MIPRLTNRVHCCYDDLGLRKVFCKWMVWDGRRIHSPIVHRLRDNLSCWWVLNSSGLWSSNCATSASPLPTLDGIHCVSKLELIESTSRSITTLTLPMQDDFCDGCSICLNKSHFVVCITTKRLDVVHVHSSRILFQIFDSLFIERLGLFYSLINTFSGDKDSTEHTNITSFFLIMPEQAYILAALNDQHYCDAMISSWMTFPPSSRLHTFEVQYSKISSTIRKSRGRCWWEILLFQGTSQSSQVVTTPRFWWWWMDRAGFELGLWRTTKSNINTVSRYISGNILNYAASVSSIGRNVVSLGSSGRT